jgi:hypothetical protein
MAEKSLFSYERGVISRYYKHLDEIMLSKISSLVTELYLAKTAEKEKQLWGRVHKAMINLKIRPAIINHIMKNRDVEILAKNLQDWLSGRR